MEHKEKQRIFWIVYDGINNSVFTSQVIIPICTMLDDDPEIEIMLISFESRSLSSEMLKKKIPAHDRLHLVLCRRLPFWGLSCLWLSIYQLARLFEQFSCSEVIARGPFAGYVAFRALDRFIAKHREKIDLYPDFLCKRLVVQARGLCAAEYHYTYKKRSQESLWWSVWTTYIHKRLLALEKMVYGTKLSTGALPYDYLIESVSPALKEYLVHHFEAPAAAIVVATRDIPPACTHEQVRAWRKTVRAMLAIPEDAVVYCYSGSFKPWQCADETVAYFAERAQRDPYIFLLVLSQDADQFKKSLLAAAVCEDQWRVIAVSHDHLYEYLSVADFGILFREKEIINWVSRPTKMLEYQAVGLNIIHNNTVAWLASKKA